MKKILAFLLFALAASFGRADTKTNYVYVVSNIYNQVFTESVVTQKVKNTHTNYYITNNVTTVNKIYNTTFKTNLSVNCDLSDTYVRAASNQANRASGYVTNACGFADSAASNATAAASSASSASSSASNAAYQRTQAANECESALATINARINWFDQHSGETITNVTVTTNITMQIDNNYHYTYKNPSGTTNANIVVYPLDLAGARVSVLPNSGQYASKAFKVWINTSNSSASTKSFTMVPSYVDSDTDGIRLQYVLDQESREKDVYYQAAVNHNNTDYPSESIVPEYAYWQNGTLYIKFQVWDNGVVTRWYLAKYAWSNFPNTVNYGSSSGVSMTLVSSSNWGYVESGNSQTRVMYFQTSTRTSTTSENVNFPDNMAPADWFSFCWMQNHSKSNQVVIINN